MIFLKQFFLNLKLSLAAKKKVSSVRTPVNFKKAEKIGLLIHMNDSSLINLIEGFAKEMIKEGKKVEGICFSNQPSSVRFTFPCQYFSYEDVDWKGDFKRDWINKFTKTSFDYLYSINILPILPFEWIIRKSEAKCRVGKYDEKSDLDLMIQIDQNKGLAFLLEQMKIYSQKINRDEVH